MPAEIYDIAFAWNWEYDSDFILGAEALCQKIHLSTYRIDPSNIESVLKKVKNGELHFKTFLDRASDEEENFIPLIKILIKEGTHFFNRHEYVDYAKNKANLHLACLGEGIDVPYTIIISPYNKKKEIELSLSELEHLGRPFIIKPANITGGGIGVVLGAESLKEIIYSRQFNKNDTYLLQEKVVPKEINGKIAWFRVFYAFGEIFSCWWNHETHVYLELHNEELTQFNLRRLKYISKILHKISKLDFFSTEIAITNDNKFVAVDYINEICDMRPQSIHHDGVPDKVILLVQQHLAEQVKLICKKTIDFH
jgi:hypothetical protein